MSLPGDNDGIAERRKLCSVKTSPDIFAFTEDPDKALVMAYMRRAVSDGRAEWDVLKSGDVWVRFATGEIFLLAATEITRL